MFVCPTLSDQPVNAAKLVSLGVGIKVDMPTVSGIEAVVSYRNEIANAVRTMQSDQDTYATAARALKKQVELSGGESRQLLRQFSSVPLSVVYKMQSLFVQV